MFPIRVLQVLVVAISLVGSHAEPSRDSPHNGMRRADDSTGGDNDGGLIGGVVGGDSSSSSVDSTAASSSASSDSAEAQPSSTISSSAVPASSTTTIESSSSSSVAPATSSSAAAPSSSEAAPPPDSSSSSSAQDAATPSSSSKQPEQTSSSANPIDESSTSNAPEPSSTTFSKVVSTHITVITKTNSDGTKSTMTTQEVTTSTPGLNTDDGDADSSGMNPKTRNTIIGVVVGVGGAIILGALGLVAWKIWGRKKHSEENDPFMAYGHNEGYTGIEKSNEAGSSAGTQQSPFQTALENHHQPTGPVNASSNF